MPVGRDNASVPQIVPVKSDRDASIKFPESLHITALLPACRLYICSLRRWGELESSVV